MYLEENSLDDILMRLYKSFRQNEWDYVNATKGENYEKPAVLIKLNNPLSRISTTEGKGTIFSCLGELIWYLSGSNSLNQIQYYLKDYYKFSDNGKTIYGAYGPRIFGPKRNSQIENVIKLLKNNPYTRKAVIQIFSKNDIKKKHKDIPCTCTLQFMIRNDKLNLYTSMRSNDMYRGLPHDIFSFTMIQEIVSRRLNIDIGYYSHYVTSMHLYKSDISDTGCFIREGWQELSEMPSMPTNNITKNVNSLIKFERDVRNGNNVDAANFFEEPYWIDLGKLLQFFWHTKQGHHTSKLKEIESSIGNELYRYYLNKKIKAIDNEDTNYASI